MDYHALWIDPDDPNHLIAGTDGGVYVTYDRGGGWRHVPNLPVSQFYRVAVDDRRPFYVYGGLQDNGSWRAPSRSPRRHRERRLGEPGRRRRLLHRGVDPADPDLVYWEWQGGNINRRHLDTGENKDIQPQPAPATPDLAGTGTPPSPSARPTRRGSTSAASSCSARPTAATPGSAFGDDLTTNDPEKQRQLESGGLTIDNTTAENHCTIFTIARVAPDQTGHLGGHRRRQPAGHGRRRRRLERGRRADQAGLPDRHLGQLRGGVAPTTGRRPSSPSTATATATSRPYVLREPTTWAAPGAPSRPTRSTATGHVIRQDPVNPDLLFLGTEGGLFITPGRRPALGPLREDFPPVSVRDLVIQARESSLVIATHGRGLWIIDDVSPLRQLTAAGARGACSCSPRKPTVLDTPRGPSIRRATPSSRPATPSSSAASSTT